MKQSTLDALRAHLIHLGSMPGEAEIMSTAADNNLPAGASFAEALEYVISHFGV